VTSFRSRLISTRNCSFENAARTVRLWLSTAYFFFAFFLQLDVYQLAELESRLLLSSQDAMIDPLASAVHESAVGALPWHQAAQIARAGLLCVVSHLLRRVRCCVSVVQDGAEIGDTQECSILKGYFRILFTFVFFCFLSREFHGKVKRRFENANAGLDLLKKRVLAYASFSSDSRYTPLQAFNVRIHTKKAR